MIYNVAVKVVELVEADSPEAATAVLVRRLTGRGFEVYDHCHAFVSEPLDDVEPVR